MKRSNSFNNKKILCMLLLLFVCITSMFCGNTKKSVIVYPEKELRVPQSDLYYVYLNGNTRQNVTIFKNTCNQYCKGMFGEKPNDIKTLTKFKDRSIHWGHFSFQGQVRVDVYVNEDISSKEINIYPSRYGVKPHKISARHFAFTLNQTGQFSIELGTDGYKKVLLLFADPIEIDKPEALTEWKIIESGKPLLSQLSMNDSSVYFPKGVHDIGIFKVPSYVKNIYLEGGAWLWGAFIMDGKSCSDVKIYGRGVLSGAKLHLRESNMIEAKNGSDRIIVNGIVVADYSYFAVRLLGINNKVSWVKIVGGWIYNCDGIAVYAHSIVKNCFIWANDDNIKIYRDNIVVKDIVCWQLNNGAIFQLNWNSSQASNCYVSQVDIIRAEWDSDRPNNGILSCRSSGGFNEGFIFENIRTDTPVTHIFRLSPQGGGKHIIRNFVFRHWDILVDNSKGKSNYLEGSTKETPLMGIVFEDFRVNGVILTESNLNKLLKLHISNCEKIIFK